MVQEKQLDWIQGELEFQKEFDLVQGVLGVQGKLELVLWLEALQRVVNTITHNSIKLQKGGERYHKVFIIMILRKPF